MRLIEERRGGNTISYVYEPGSYVPLARLDADGEKTDQGGLGTVDDAQPPDAINGVAFSASQTGATGSNPSKNAADDAESRYWASLNETAGQKRKRCKSRTPEQKGLRQMHAKPSYARSTTSTPTR